MLLLFHQASPWHHPHLFLGPEFVTPILGGIVEMVKDPYGFWEKQRKYSCPGMSWHR